MGFDNIWFVWNVCRYEIFFAVNAPNFVNYELSSKEYFIFNGLMGFLVLEWWFFDVVKSGEMLDFSGFARSGYRSDFELRKSIFRSKYGCGTDSLVFAAGYLFLNVNYPPTCFDPKRYCNSVVLLYIFDITCISIIFATYL